MSGTKSNVRLQGEMPVRLRFRDNDHDLEVEFILPFAAKGWVDVIDYSEDKAPYELAAQLVHLGLINMIPLAAFESLDANGVGLVAQDPHITSGFSEPKHD